MRKAARSAEFLLTRPLRDVTNALRAFPHPKQFLLTRPLRDVTNGKMNAVTVIIFLLTRPLRDVTIISIQFYSIYFAISTHTPLAGRDKCET